MLMKATELVQASELAKQETAEINEGPHGSPQMDPVNKLSSNMMSSDRECYRCKETLTL